MVVDKETYDATPVNDRRAVDKYTYELELNDSKREIKILDKRYLNPVLTGLDAAVRLAKDV